MSDHDFPVGFFDRDDPSRPGSNTLCHVSIDYLVRPIEVLSECARVLRRVGRGDPLYAVVGQRD